MASSYLIEVLVYTRRVVDGRLKTLASRIPIAPTQGPRSSTATCSRVVDSLIEGVRQEPLALGTDPTSVF